MVYFINGYSDFFWKEYFFLAVEFSVPERPADKTQ